VAGAAVTEEETIDMSLEIQSFPLRGRRRVRTGRAVFGLVCAMLIPSCDQLTSVPVGEGPKNDLSKLKTAEVVIRRADGESNGDVARYTVYIADTFETRQVGLMNTTEAELPTDRGMLFIFAYDQYLSFWMRNTIIPLDIAYVRSDGTILKTYTMPPLDESGFPSFEPARFALELRAGQLAEKGIREGDRIEFPPEVLNSDAR
jgi:hypothetical protein